MSLRIAVDVGGTFTDGVLLEEKTGRIWLAKSLTTYGDPGDAIAEVSQALLAQYGKAADVTQVVHGTTLVTNMLVERKGVRTALITTAGMADCLEIRRELRYDTYDLALAYPKPLVDRADVHEVSARLAPDGSEWQVLETPELEKLAAVLSKSGVEAIAICLLHSPVSSRHEVAAAEFLARALPGKPVSYSSAVAAEVGEYERMSTVVANAYVQPMVERYLERLKARFEALGVTARLDIMLSHGGFSTAKEAARFPIRLLESGPAGGVLSAINCAAADGTTHVLAFDMGGTTAKSCVAVDGRPDVTHIFEFAREKRFKKGSGLPAVAPSIDLIEIGAGGGSIARRNAMGLLQVGPDSAGSEPGPACYGLGGTNATVTDADLALGYLDADAFLGGRMKLKPEMAWAALEKVGALVGLDAKKTAIGIHELVAENMASAARTHIAEKGLDARKFTLVATGGAGPVHAVDVARRLRIKRVLCPIASGVGSCLGFLAAPARGDRSWSRVEAARTIDVPAVRDRLATAKRQIEAELATAGVTLAEVTWRAAVEMRYQGQGASVEVAIDPAGIKSPEALCEAFLQTYREVFGRAVPGGIPEIVTWRLSGTTGEGLRKYVLGSAVPNDTQARGKREIYSPASRSMVEATVYPRGSLKPRQTVRGPCLITEAESTLVVSWPATVTVQELGTLEILLDEVAA